MSLEQLLSSKDPTEFTKGLRQTTRCILDMNENLEKRWQHLDLLSKHNSSEAIEILSRMRDSLPFLKNEVHRKDMLDLIVRSCKSTGFDSFERLRSAMTLYNREYIDLCYECFESISSDCENFKCRVEALLMLFCSEDEENVKKVQSVLTEIIDDLSIPSSQRYDIIATFNSKSGIRSFMNVDKIRVPHNEPFVCGIQTVFFYNDKNGIRERILSGQNLLQMECVSEAEKKDICSTLLEITKNESLPENVRADAADVVLRLGPIEDRKASRRLISQIGFSEAKKSANMFFAVPTVYNNSQNIHEFDDQIQHLLEKVMDEEKVYPTFEKTMEEISARLVKIKSQKIKSDVRQALHRVSIDTATFTKYNATLPEILSVTWAYIHAAGRYTPEQVLTLEKRLFQELAAMDDTCSTGHYGRFVVVLSTFEDTFKISFKQQILANVNGRFNAVIKKQDDATREKIAIGQAEIATDEEKQFLVDFSTEQFDILRKEMYSEFVDEGYVSVDEFEKYYSSAVTKVKESMKI